MAGDVKIPPWHKPPVDVTVSELREFMAQHGADVSVLTTWTRETSVYQFITIGSNRAYADAAVVLRNTLADALKLTPLDPGGEDLRGDHPNVSLTLEQVDFMLWLLGYINAASEEMDAGHKEYIMKHHNALLPVLGNAKKRIVNKPV